MQYLERTLQVKNALLQRPDLLKHIGDVFRKHIAGDRKQLPWKGGGTLRVVYAVGTCEVPDGTFNLLLKVRHEVGTLSDFARLSGIGEKYPATMTMEREELGAADAYYSFAAGLMDEMGFKSPESFAQFLDEAQTTYAPGECRLFQQTPMRFRFDSKQWFGTRVAVGDIGALPYANVVLQCDGVYGLIVEGRPPIIESKRTAFENNDDSTVEHGRLVDLGSAQCFLSKLNGKMNRQTCVHGDLLGLIARGGKYFLPKYRIDL